MAYSATFNFQPEPAGNMKKMSITCAYFHRAVARLLQHLLLRHANGYSYSFAYGYVYGYCYGYSYSNSYSYCYSYSYSYLLLRQLRPLRHQHQQLRLLPGRHRRQELRPTPRARPTPPPRP